MPSGNERGDMKRLVILVMWAAFFLLNVSVTQSGAGLNSAQAAEPAWKTEFDEVCSQTDNSMEMGVVELKKALERCDKLKVQLEQLEPSTRKVYLRRLQMCRNLFDYMLESKQKETQK